MAPIRLRGLGPVSVSVDGSISGTAITQPRLLALLAYLVVARPRGQHSRDTLIALLWPDADQSSGRQSLRNALHRLRGSIGEAAVVSVGETFVTVGPGAITSDVLEFEDAANAQRWSEAIASYRGPFLQGFHVDGAPEFDLWLDRERTRLTNIALEAAAAVVRESGATSDHGPALNAAAFACSLAPDDERVFRQYLELLVDSGDNAGARKAYDAFAQRLKVELDVEPAAETHALLRKARRLPREAPVNRQAPQVGDASTAGAATAPGKHRRPSRMIITTVAFAVVLFALAVSRWRTVATATDSGTMVAAPDLHRRWRADTALLARYLQGKAQVVSRNAPGARETFTSLTQDAPLYAPGWAGLALATLRSATGDLPPSDAMRRGLHAAERALAMDSSLVMAHQALIYNELVGRWDLTRAKERLDEALARHPRDPELLNLLADWHLWRGEFDEMLALKRANSENEPLTTRYVFQVLPNLFYSRRCTEAAEVYRQLPPEIRHAVAESAPVPALLCAGMRDEAAVVLREHAIRQGDSAMARLFVDPLTPARRDSAIENALRLRLERQHTRRRSAWVPPERIMLNYALRQHVDSTLIWLDSMIVGRSVMLHVVPFDPLMDFLRGEARFDSALTRLTWLPAVAPSARQLIDSLRQRARRR